MTAPWGTSILVLGCVIALISLPVDSDDMAFTGAIMGLCGLLIAIIEVYT